MPDKHSVQRTAEQQSMGTWCCDGHIGMWQQYTCVHMLMVMLLILVPNGAWEARKHDQA